MKRQQAEPVTKEELRFALGIGNAAASGKMARASPTTSRNIYALADNPYNRGTVAALDEFRHRPVRYRLSIIWRLGLLRDIADDPAFTEWWEAEQLPDSLFEALATFPTKLGGRLDRIQLLGAIRRIEKRPREGRTKG